MAKGSREQMIRSLINIWLKFPTNICATCGEDWMGEPCCENPVISNNREAYECFLKELKDIRETRANCYASNEAKNMRWGCSLPANLYMFLDRSMQKLYKERLFTKEHDSFWFIKQFPQFQVPERI